jgi:hypothetical protein
LNSLQLKFRTRQLIENILQESAQSKGIALVKGSSCQTIDSSTFPAAYNNRSSSNTMPSTTQSLPQDKQVQPFRPVWRSTTLTTKTANQEFLRDCTNALELDEEKDLTNTPCTVISNAISTRSKSFEENLVRTNMNFNVNLDNVEVSSSFSLDAKGIAQEPNLVIPDLDQDAKKSDIDANRIGRQHHDQSQSSSHSSTAFRRIHSAPAPKITSLSSMQSQSQNQVQSQSQATPGTAGSQPAQRHGHAHTHAPQTRGPLVQPAAYFRNENPNVKAPLQSQASHRFMYVDQQKNMWSNANTNPTAAMESSRLQPPPSMFSNSYSQISAQQLPHSQKSSGANPNATTAKGERRQESSSPSPGPANRNAATTNTNNYARSPHPNKPSNHGNASTPYASKMQGSPMHSSKYHQFQHHKSSSRMSEHSRAAPYNPKQSPAHSSSWHHSNHSHPHQHHHQQSYQHRNSSAHASSGKNSITASPNGRQHSSHHSHSQQSHQHQHQTSSYSSTGGTGSRSAPEVLKTLLRKKACLYEAGTSRAIALVTWLVGRNLALHNGYFSRQRLQAGVHAVVASKIDSGMITRTKVNRCMQIILNSCFHYIIPRPDGTEENGDAFCDAFKETVTNDVHLLKALLPPWNNLDIADADQVIYEQEVNVPTSPKAETDETKGEAKDHKENHVPVGGAAPSKRLVLLCFNENVRSAEDVLRCHNDFIRDAAISSNLHLTADEWRYFFSRKDDDCSQTSCTLDSAPSVGGAGIHSSPMLRGVEGGDIPYLSFDIPDEVSNCIDFKDSVVSEPKVKCTDPHGQMCNNELSKFRTTWCCKRYEHDAKLCRFAHVDENGGWLRRDPTLFSYSDKLCPFTTVIKFDDPLLNDCNVNACPDGMLCKFAHSQEEVDYHPKCYKSKVCESSKGNTSRPCNLLDVCPHSHPSGHTGHHQRSGRRRHDSFSSRRGGGTKHVQNEDGGDKYQVPGGTPILYLSPAPISELEKSFQFPGLQGLFRRNCVVHYSNQSGVTEEKPKYHLFGDHCGLNDSLFHAEDGLTNGFSLYSEAP